MIRIVIVDDHPALRAGLETVLRGEPGIVPVGSASNAEELWPLLNRTAPDLVVLDYHLPGEDGLELCRKIKARVPAPRVLIYSAYATSALSIPAAVAGADGLLSKGSVARDLYDTIRRVARGERVMPPIEREMLADASGRLAPEDHPVLAMLLDDTPAGEIADVLGIDASEVQERIDRIIATLHIDVPSTSV